MFKNFLSLVILILPWQLKAADMTYKVFEDDKYREVKISVHEGTRVSSDCLKNGKINCAAWSSYQGKPATRSKANKELMGNPAALYCWDLKAKNLILKASDGSQSDYCVFADGSMIDSWQIYRKHFDKK